MFRCVECGKLTNEPKAQYESVAVGDGYGNYPVGIVCPSCGGDVEEITSWENAIMDEIDMILECNFDNYETGIDLTSDEKYEIARDMIDNDYQFWEDINEIVRKSITIKLIDKLKYLRDKEKVSSLDKEEKFDLETLTMWEKGELL